MIGAIVIGILVGAIIVQDYNKFRLVEMHTKAYESMRDKFEADREVWRAERQQLLDRIQAPSFAEYKHAEVKTIKAQQGTDKEPSKLEVM